ncbi:MAG: class I SAM-dependent methyltransferase [Bacteroidales bacterium]|jgi:predicted O-methyltransferase YrrM|nr:class I SAM-dependent methyltransferase [Bacteroidales bacterium]
MIEAIQKHYQLADKEIGSIVTPGEARHIYTIVKNNNFKTTLEIGFGLGFSASHIIAATNSLHVAIDPFQKNRFENDGIAIFSQLGIIDKLQLITDYSHFALPQLLQERRRFDFIFIDGDHKFDSVFVDFHYCEKLLNPGGIIVFHDAWMRSVSSIKSYIKNNRPDFQILHSPEKRLLVIKKIGEDSRSWLDFKSFRNSLPAVIAHTITKWKWSKRMKKTQK